jgi:hypothetical protein
MNTQDSYFLAKKLEQLKQLKQLDHVKQLNLIFEWVKTGHINRSSFQRLISHITTE